MPVGAQLAALEVYQQLRATLVGELGVEPSGRIQRLHQEVLNEGQGRLSDASSSPELLLRAG
ncbi:BTAD domain-containing putative transcriptional regulator [Streptomyces sp. S063]|uniref:BTAD domain-containing putative transcriptional regulator n=1 Tax=Streptomyces sp. S063 TaxID=2005885 RepID=UPI00202AF0A2|nr:BTAD domain-containing putative transcriptional regulator [Streptomyces sp. S063]